MLYAACAVLLKVPEDNSYLELAIRVLDEVLGAVAYHIQNLAAVLTKQYWYLND